MIASADLSRAQLRRQLRQLRRQLPALEQRRASQALYRRIVHSPSFRRARHLALYLAADGEIDPRPLLQAAQTQGKQVYLPVLRRWPHNRMNFQQVRPGERLVRNRYGIAEPAQCRARQRAAWTLDLLLLPLVGFDAHGGRLGMGGGFYDRSLAYLARRKNWHKPTMLGLAHECQRVDKLPLAEWDVRLTAVVTPRRWYRTGPVS
jgi:5-formyltetrahydrofolate cyclo-ligase